MKVMRVKKPGGFENLQLVEEEPRAPERNQISVRIRASSLNYHDMHVATGGLAVEEGRIPMSDGAGEVIAVGEGVTEFAVGAHVMGTFFPAWQSGNLQPEQLRQMAGDGVDGYASTIVTRPAKHFTRMPDGYSFEEAATLPCAGLTAWDALMERSTLGAGNTVLVQGTGGVSIFGLQIAKAIGARVIATTSSAHKVERLKSLGADHVIYSRETPDWAAAAVSLTDGRGVDHILDVGGGDSFARSITAASVGGTISVIGALGGRAESTIPALGIAIRQLTIHGILVGSRVHQENMVRFVEEKKIRPIIDRRYPLEQLADAFRYQESGAHFGKITVEF